MLKSNRKARLVVVGILLLLLVFFGSSYVWDSFNAVPMASKKIIGKWLMKEAIEAYPYPFTPAAKEITFFANGTFDSKYEGKRLEILRKYLRNETIGPEISGRYQIIGRSSYDLWMSPVFIKMRFGPERRTLEVSGDSLILGKVGDSWQKVVYTRTRTPVRLKKSKR